MNCDFNCNGKIMAIKVEHDACDSNNDYDVKPKLKFNNYVKCENKCFDAVDKWINKAIVKVPTGDNWHNIIQREIALLKVRYPFLTEKQLKGKALVKFGIPCLMGDVIRTGDKKVTGALAKELLRTRERKQRIPAPFKVVKKINPFVKKLKSSSPPSKIENYLESNSDKKFLEITTKMPQTPIKTYSKYGLRNPYYSKNNENYCPSTPQKRKVYDPQFSTWVEVNDDQQTPVKTCRLTPVKSENRKYLVSITQAAKEMFVASPGSELSQKSVENFSQCSVRRELLEKLKEYPFAGQVFWNDKSQGDSENVSESEVLQIKTSQETIQSQETPMIDMNISSQAITEYVPSPMTSQSQGMAMNDIDVTTPKSCDLVSLSELKSVRQSFERLSFNDSDSIASISSMGERTQCLSINSNHIVSPLTQDSLRTPSLLSQGKFPASFDHDYAKSDTQQLTPSFDVSPISSQIIPVTQSTFKDVDELTPLQLSGKVPSVEIFTPPSFFSQSVLLRTPTLSNLSIAKNFSDDEFSGTNDSSPVKLLSNCCDEFSEGWKKVPPSRLVPPSTDIRKKLKNVSLQNIKEQVHAVINFLDGVDAQDD